MMIWHNKMIFWFISWVKFWLNINVNRCIINIDNKKINRIRTNLVQCSRGAESFIDVSVGVRFDSGFSNYFGTVGYFVHHFMVSQHPKVFLFFGFLSFICFEHSVNRSLRSSVLCWIKINNFVLARKINKISLTKIIKLTANNIDRKINWEFYKNSKV